MIHKNHVTVLMTTSDESDCLNGDIMGYLRNGQLLVEDSPNVLMQSYGVSTISKLLYCVSIADHHLTSNDRRLTALTERDANESMTSIVSGGFTLTANETVNDSADDNEVLNKMPKNSRPVGHLNRVSKYFGRGLWSMCSTNAIVRSRQRSKVVRLWTLFQWGILSVTRSYLMQIVYIVFPIVLLCMYYYSVKDFLEIDLGIGELIDDCFGLLMSF